MGMKGTGGNKDFSLFLYIVVINNINMQYDILYASTEGDENI